MRSRANATYGWAAISLRSLFEIYCVYCFPELNKHRIFLVKREGELGTIETF